MWYTIHTCDLVCHYLTVLLDDLAYRQQHPSTFELSPAFIQIILHDWWFIHLSLSFALTCCMLACLITPRVCAQVLHNWTQTWCSFTAQTQTSWKKPNLTRGAGTWLSATTTTGRMCKQTKHQTQWGVQMCMAFNSHHNWANVHGEMRPSLWWTQYPPFSSPVWRHRLFW